MGRPGRSKHRLEYHIVLTTKYRKKCLSEIEGKVKESFFRASDSKLRVSEVGIDQDHVHVVVSVHPSLSVSTVVSRLKQLTTYWLWSVEGESLSNYYWGSKKILWSGGYFAESIGRVSRDTVLDYVRGQGDSSDR